MPQTGEVKCVGCGEKIAPKVDPCPVCHLPRWHSELKREG